MSTNDPQGPLAVTSIPAAAERSRATKNSDKTVLVIEDDAVNMKLCHDLLKTRGYNVLQAKQGMQGWDIAREHRPDLILMDIRLPDISGLEVTKWLKDDEDLKSIPVIAMTAFAIIGDAEKFLQNGCNGYISKPISVFNLLQTIDRFAAEVEGTMAMPNLRTAKSMK